MATVTIPNVFVSGALIKSSEMNANFNAITAQVNGGLEAVNLAGDAVTTAKIENLAVTSAKIATGGVDTLQLADDAVTTIKVLDANVTTGKLAAYAATSPKTAGVPIRTVVANDTLTIDDYLGMVIANSASAIILTIPLEATVAWPAGSVINFLRQGAGTVTIAIASGGVLQFSVGLGISAQWQSASALKIGTDEWVLLGSAS